MSNTWAPPSRSKTRFIDIAGCFFKGIVELKSQVEGAGGVSGDHLREVETVST